MKFHNKSRKIDTKGTIFLDSDSNAAMMCNENYVEYVQDTNSKMPIEMNGSLITIRQKCLICSLGKFLFSTNLITSILSFSNAVDKCRVTMSTSTESAVEVCFPK